MGKALDDAYLPVQVVSEATGELETINGADRILPWLHIAKVFLMAASADDMLDAFGGPLPDEGPARNAEVARRTKAVIEGLAGVGGVACLMGAALLYAAAKDHPQIAEDCLDMAGKATKAARSIGASKVLTSTLALLTLTADLYVLADPTSNFEQRLDATVGATAALAKLLSVGGAASATAASIAIPAGYWMWKTAMMEMGETRLGVTGWHAATELDQMVRGADAVGVAFDPVVASQAMAREESEVRWAAAYRGAAAAFSGSVAGPAEHLREISRGWRTRWFRGVIDGVYTLHAPAAQGSDVSPAAVAAFVDDLASEVSFTLAHLPEIVGFESGIKTDPPGPDLPVSPSPLEQAPTE